MSAFVRGGINVERVLRQPIHSFRASNLVACKFPGSKCTPSNVPLLHHEHSNKQYYSTSPGKSVAKWLSRRLLALVALAGVTGGAVLVVSGFAGS